MCGRALAQIELNSLSENTSYVIPAENYTAITSTDIMFEVGRDGPVRLTLGLSARPSSSCV